MLLNALINVHAKIKIQIGKSPAQNRKSRKTIDRTVLRPFTNKHRRFSENKNKKQGRSKYNDEELTCIINAKVLYSFKSSKLFSKTCKKVLRQRQQQKIKAQMNHIEMRFCCMLRSMHPSLRHLFSLARALAEETRLEKRRLFTQARYIHTIRCFPIVVTIDVLAYAIVSTCVISYCDWLRNVTKHTFQLRQSVNGIHQNDNHKKKSYCVDRP